jgi:predicted MPP superfamily phosphohydrolase
MAAVTRLLDGIETDLCVLTGDYKYGHYGPPDRVPVHLARVLAGIRSAHGFHAILGNHDLASMVPLLEGIGVTMLVNRGLAVPFGGATVWLAGVDDPHKFRAAHLPSAMAGAPAEAFKIALVHSPECAEEADALGARLYLCGHTHGGQLRLPLWGAIKLNSRSKVEYARGHWRCGAMQGYTTDGLGVTDFPLRFNCPPEACLFTLRRAGD